MYPRFGMNYLAYYTIEAELMAARRQSRADAKHRNEAQPARRSDEDGAFLRGLAVIAAIAVVVGAFILIAAFAGGVGR